MPYVAATDAPTKTAYNILRLEVFSLNFSYFVCDSRCCVKTLVVETVVCTDDNHSLKYCSSSSIYHTNENVKWLQYFE